LNDPGSAEAAEIVGALKRDSGSTEGRCATMPEKDRRVLDVFTLGADSGFLSTALIAVRTRMSVETVREILERLRAQGLVRLHGSDPDAWALME
jgi:hypothetical protein